MVHGGTLVLPNSRTHKLRKCFVAKWTTHTRTARYLGSEQTAAWALNMGGGG